MSFRLPFRSAPDAIVLPFIFDIDAFKQETFEPDFEAIWDAFASWPRIKNQKDQQKHHRPDKEALSIMPTFAGHGSSPQPEEGFLPTPYISSAQIGSYAEQLQTAATQADEQPLRYLPAWDEIERLFYAD